MRRLNIKISNRERLSYGPVYISPYFDTSTFAFEIEVSYSTKYLLRLSYRRFQCSRSVYMGVYGMPIDSMHLGPCETYVHLL